MFWRSVFESLLPKNRSVSVTFTTGTGAITPLHLQEEPRVTFLYGLNLPKPIVDLKSDEFGISATLSFSGVPEFTFVPWDAVIAVVAEPYPAEEEVLPSLKDLN